MIDIETAEEAIESIFNFDYVGDCTMEVRRNLESVELQQKLIEEMVDAAIPKAGAGSAESIAVVAEAAEARVLRYVNGSKAAKGTGCGG